MRTASLWMIPFGRRLRHCNECLVLKIKDVEVRSREVFAAKVSRLVLFL